MAVFRVHKTDNYTVMSNHHLRDKGLSLSAKGLLSVILSLPPDWKYSIRGLAQISKEGERAIRSALKELRESGYIVVSRVNPKPGNSHVRYVYDIYEIPISVSEHDESVPETAKPQFGQAYPSEGVQREGVVPEGAVGEGVLTVGQLSTDGLTYGEISTDQSITDNGSKKQCVKSSEPTPELKTIIDYLNAKVGTNYTYRNKANNKLINARLSEGFTVDDFKAVIDKKHAEWFGTEWQKFLCPSTLFAPSHFENYLNQPAPQGGKQRDHSAFKRKFGC